MSWWTQNRKLILPAAGLLALNMIPGVGQAVSAGLSSLTGGLLGGAGAGGVAGGVAGAAMGGAGAGTAQALGTSAATELAKTGTIAALEGGGLGSGASLVGTGASQAATPAASSMFAESIPGVMGDAARQAATMPGTLQGTGLLANSTPMPFGAEQAAQFASNANPQFYDPSISTMSRIGNFAKAAGKGAYQTAGAMGAANSAMSLVQRPQMPEPQRPPQAQFQATPVNPAYGMGMDTPPAGIDPRQWAMMTEDQKRRFKGGV